MARAIDIQPIIEKIQSSLKIPSYSEHDKGFDDGLKYVLDLIEKTPTLTPLNEPLTLEELEGFVEPTPVWWDWVCGWVLARKGMIVTWDWRYHNVKELKLRGNFYRRPPEGEV